MLATSVRGRHLSGEWLLEPKLDGWRALVYVEGTVTVRTRTGRKVTAIVPRSNQASATTSYTCTSST